MYKQLLITTLSFLFTTPLWSFTCYFTLAKDNCWTKYSVSVDVIDANTAQVLKTIVVPAGQSWTRDSFICKPGQKLKYHTQFTPVIWESDKGKIYPAKDYWSLPAAIAAGSTAWELSVCYPSDFSELPMPPEATSNCSCNFAVIPALKPQ